ncbi:phospholipase A2 inhibitor and Ly6/PLAUR domain-containing protein-like [Mauremys mutica]|uniref:phospholipase A2 inhibitor and Ly6/PLAUR domain-containing protein-like n=1 Tax=Mauremys mutica TaxID=74926 RepID=UPI001D16A9B7|nr:phospholipase A2 inhibitor and Ly6/PLAUR domain-containing protein-like [Mauremys mutica]XP_044847049.1 phospholipase A2 inhibitor and Ly6/PLAUR domain-containing protein-like [Mauremys mutica]
MELRLIFCLLWALPATANAVSLWPSSCYQGVPGKSSVARRCNRDENSCLTVQEENTLGGVVNTGVLQACGNNMRSLVGNLDFEFGGGVYVRILSLICGHTDCNTGEMKERPKISTVPNGRQCPSCFAPGSHLCLHNVTLHCQGAANQCVDVVGTLSENGVEIPFAARGCATQDVAKIKAGDVLMSGVFTYRIKSIQLNPAPRTETMDDF